MPKVTKFGVYDLNKNFASVNTPTISYNKKDNLLYWVKLNSFQSTDSSTYQRSVGYVNFSSLQSIYVDNFDYTQMFDGGTFNGTNSYFFTADSDDLSFGDGSQDYPFSVSLWLKVDDLSSAPGIFTKGFNVLPIPNSIEYYLTAQSTGRLQFVLYDESSSNQSTASSNAAKIIEGQWHHVVITYNGDPDSANPVIIYIDNVDETSSFTKGAGYVAMENKNGQLVGGYDANTVSYLDGSISEFAVFNTVLSANDVTAIYERTGYDYVKSGFISLPPRVLTRQFDSATGSYPTIARTGDATRKGNYPIKFDDTYTVPFKSSFATADIDFGYSLSGGSSSMFPNDFDNIVLTDADGNSATIVFLNTSLIATTDPLPDYPVYYTDKLDRVAIAERFAAQINDNAGLKLRAKVTKVKKASLGLGIGTRYTSVVVTITQSLPGLLGNQSIARSTQTFTERTATVKSARGIDVFTYYHYGLTIPSAFTGGKELSVNRTTNLPGAAERLQSQAYASPNILETQLDGSGSIVAGVADAHIRFTPGEDLGPFTDSRINLSDSLFYEEGTPESVCPGFSSKLGSKTQIVHHLSASSETEFGYKRFISDSPDLDESGNGQILMVYWNHSLKKWEEIGQPINQNNYTNPTNETMISMLTSSCLGFSGIDVIATGSSSSVSTQNFMDKNFLKSLARPTDAFGFPFGAQYHATSSQYQTAKSMFGIEEPFLVEKISIEFNAKFGIAATSAVAGFDADELFSPLYSYPDGADKSALSKLGAIKLINPTFFILRQKPTNPFTKTINFNKDFFADLDPANQIIYNSNIPNSIPRVSGSSALTYVEDTREMLSYGQMMIVGTGSAGASLQQTAGEILQAGLERDLNIVHNIDISGDQRDSITGSFIIDFPVRSTSKLPPVGSYRYNYDATRPLAADTDVTLIGNESGGRSNGLLESGNRGIVNNFGGNSIEKNILIPGDSTTDDPLSISIPTLESIDQSSPYLLMPSDKIILGFQYPFDPSRQNYRFLEKQYPQIVAFYTMTLFGGTKITLYGSQVKDNREFHDTLNQPLTSDAVHEAIHYDNPVLDQFEVENASEYVGSYQDDFFPGKNTNTNPIDRLGLYITSSVSQSAEIGESYAFQRNTTIFNRNLTYFDSYLPSLLSLIQSDPKAIRYSLPDYNQNDIRFPIEYVGTLPNPFTGTSDYTASYSASSSERSFLTSRNRFIFDDESSSSRNWRRRASVSALRPQGFDADLFYKGTTGFNDFCKNKLSNPYSVDTERFISQIEDFSIVVGQLSKIEYDEDSTGAQERTTDQKDSAAIASGSFPKLIGITGQKLRELIVGDINFNDTTLFYNRQGGSGDGSTISSAPGADDYPTLTASFQEADFSIPTPKNVPYGMVSLTPANQKYVFRGSRYGQFSDLIYAPAETKFFNSNTPNFSARSSNVLKKGIQTAAVSVAFVSGSRNTGLTLRNFKRKGAEIQVVTEPYFQSSNISTECTSSLPYYDDDVPRNRSYPTEFV